MLKQLLLHAHRYTSRRRLSTTHTLDTPATRPRTVHSYPLRAWTSSNFILHIFGPTQLALHRKRPTMTLGTQDAGITSVSTLTGASATAKTAAMEFACFRGISRGAVYARCTAPFPWYCSTLELTERRDPESRHQREMYKRGTWKQRSKRKEGSAPSTSQHAAG